MLCTHERWGQVDSGTGTASVLCELLMGVCGTETCGTHIESRRLGYCWRWVLLAACVLAGCETSPPPRTAAVSGIGVPQERFVRYLGSEQCNVFLSPLGLQRIRYVPVVPEYNLLWLSGTPDQVNRAKRILDVVDSPEDYCIVNLGPASKADTLPSRAQIESALGNVSIGTFGQPPANGARLRVIVDTQGDSVLAFLPVRYRDRLRAVLEGGVAATDSVPAAQAHTAPQQQISEQPAPPPRAVSSPSQPAPQESRPSTGIIAGPLGPREARGEGRGAAARKVEQPASDSKPAKTVRIVFTAAPNAPTSPEAELITDRAMPRNGEDLIDMTLPETVTVIQLLDLAGKYMGLTYVYDPREVTNLSVALKLSGNLQGEMKVKNLYALLQTVLGELGLAMIRQQDNLVAVVKIDKALQTQPDLVVNDTNSVQVGDTVVTRAFNVRYVDILSVKTLLEDMKLSVATTALENANLLLVTCHADRMNRVEQLVEMIDRPGKPTECRVRRLSYTIATPLVAKVRTLAQELEGIVVATAVTTSPGVKPAAPAIPIPIPVPVPAAKPAQSGAGRPVYLDAEERTNSVLMIGYEAELTLIEQLIDVLDVAQADPRSPHIYDLAYIEASQALEKLQKLEVLKSPKNDPAASKEASDGNILTGEPLVTVLEATNQLLVRAAAEQHTQIGEFLSYIDIAPGSDKTLAYYELKCVKADAAKAMLEELDLVRAAAAVSASAATAAPGPNEPLLARAQQMPDARALDRATDKPQVVVNASTNALLVKATAEQHEQIAGVLQYIDKTSPEDELAYRIYPVENSSPEHISSMLERLLVETKKDKEGKIEKIPKTQEQITVVPDPNTYSLIVYASQKNQQMMGDLINKLDKRRPQVLIDVTLVEITRSDTFEYDLNLVANANDAVVGNIALDPIQSIDSRSRLESGFNLRDQDGNPTGQTQIFYSDRKVQALLTAIQRKNYGRVLAKPKVLVDDGQEGQIVTTDETTYVKESIQIPQTGTPITTRDFVPIQAGIQLKITPHISEGNLLRLAVHMSRDDFGTRPLSGAPPDKATSELTTTVFVPDERTVILGGLVKLNQTKAGSKVPILGDIPLAGALFRSVNNNDIEKKLYVFLKANIVRPFDESQLKDLQAISKEHEDAFEKSESQFQEVETIPGISPKPMPPKRILKDY